MEYSIKKKSPKLNNSGLDYIILKVKFIAFLNRNIS